ncbi:hypothetical protein BP6252_13328 [Coleophoma cylindrospora]|uniref:NACHT domain-containing protein n=1 Tax=Coleophoma cylindrospora TaxID=1849047 RepID=A0A3D8QAH7_9HELO|nr:hypothetical protein BP6252_13328 [Coleophoma cylindrospora]
MRLLEILPSGGFRLTETLPPHAIPQYAILSHTWGNDEVTFEDLVADTAKGKAGYEKIKFCGEQAARDGLHYFWVDSCCIKKSSDAELTESLNSMFRWYSRSEKCYVYLSDVSSKKRKRVAEETQGVQEQAFRESKWFTRGWTLQELLAPDSVEFFTQDKCRLGDKRSLEQQIHEITEIPISALRGASLSQFTTDQRFDWAKNRHTTREEDWAYSLLGIFEISMPVIYGERKANAVRRLKKEIDDYSKRKECVRHLYVTDPRADKIRIEETKGGLLADSYLWILENDDFKQWLNQQSRLLWIKGDPGKGKTMLLCGIINELQKSFAKTHLLSFFYCQVTDPRINNATAVLRGLLYLLIEQQPSLISHIQKQHDPVGKALFEDANAWIAVSKIFLDILQDPALKPTYLIIDALDECAVDQEKLLDFIVLGSSLSPYTKWLVSSRNWPLIEERLNKARSKSRLRLDLELNTKSVSAAVSTYIQHKVTQLAQEKGYDGETQEAVLHHLSSNANSTFLWVALVCQNLQKVKPWNVPSKLNDFPPGLESLYGRMMGQIEESDDAHLCKQILSTIAVVYQPITLRELASVADLPRNVTQKLQWLAEIISFCGSFLTTRRETVYFVHQSAKDYLLAKSFNEIFPYGIRETHHEIFSRSLEVMSKTLQRDIYSLGRPGYPIEDVQQQDADPLATCRYSCLYWVDHLCEYLDYIDGEVNLQAGGQIDLFVREKYLYWLEALSLLKAMSKGVLAMAKLDKLIQGGADAPELFQLVHDASRFIMYYKEGIEISPLQVYATGLVFTPLGSLVRRYFHKQEPNWFRIRPAIEDNWSHCLQTLGGHNDTVSSVAFSHDSTQIASASDDRTVKIWDASSGECQQTLKGHSGLVNSVAFSHDSIQIASASDDQTVKIWDVSSGECLQTLKGHSDRVNSVAFSHDSTLIASASDDQTVKIWETSSGESLKTLEGLYGEMRSVAFSHDSTQLVSAEGMCVVIWNLNSGDLPWVIGDHTKIVRSVAFSHDSTQIASASDDQTVKIWDVSSEECLKTLEGHYGELRSVAFSYDSTLLVSAGRDATVRIWDASSGECFQTLDEHCSPVLSVAISQDSSRIASASGDTTVKIWDVSGDEIFEASEGSSNDCSLAHESHGAGVTSVIFSHDSSRLASTSYDYTTKIWDSSSGACLQTLQDHHRAATSAAFSHDSTQLASSSGDKTVKIWDVTSGECLQTLKGHGEWIRSVAFSVDSKLLASASDDCTVRIWHANSGKCLRTLESHGERFNSVAFSSDSKLLASGSENGTVRTWDIESGENLMVLKGDSNEVSSVAFTPESSRLAAVSDGGMLRIWDTSSGDCLATLNVETTLYNISFDSTGSYLNTDVGILAIGASLASSIVSDGIECQIPQYHGVGLSSTREWITYNSENVLWLPSEYRPSYSAVWGNTIGIGVGSGKVWICSLSSIPERL